VGSGAPAPRDAEDLTAGDEYDPWLGQAVRDGRQIVYASVFRDVVAQLGRDGKGSKGAN
jgi:hypothetical protein